MDDDPMEQIESTDSDEDSDEDSDVESVEERENVSLFVYSLDGDSDSSPFPDIHQQDAYPSDEDDRDVAEDSQDVIANPDEMAEAVEQPTGRNAEMGQLRFNTNSTNYDLELPLEHRYLGVELETVETSQTLFPDRTRLENFPMILISNLFVIPGQMVPVIIHSMEEIRLVQNIIDTTSVRVLGIILGDDKGITAVIREMGYEDTLSSRVLKLKLQGWQRFQIERLQIGRNGRTGTVVILPDDEPPNMISMLEGNDGNSLTDKQVCQLHGLHATFARQYDAKFLVDSIIGLLKQNIHVNFEFPTDPLKLSFFMLMCLPLPKELISFLIYKNNAIERLRVSYAMLTADYSFVCSNCRTPLASKLDANIMTKTGFSTCFVNPSGNIFELFTFRRLRNYQNLTSFSFHFSWFPRYEWAILR